MASSVTLGWILHALSFIGQTEWICPLTLFGNTGFLQIFDALQMIGDVSPAVVCGGCKVAMIPVLYGLIVYFISLVIRVIQKPRI